MNSKPTRQGSAGASLRKRSVWPLFACAGLCVGAGMARGESPLDAFASSKNDPAASGATEFSGRDFGGLRFPMRAVRGRIAFGAARVTTWTRESPMTGTTIQQMLLSGDVKVRLGVYEFSAVRAVVFIERVADASDEEKAEDVPIPFAPDANLGIYQIYVYFDRVASPMAEVSVSVQANRLPVRAVIEPEDGIAVTYDLLMTGEPADPLIGEAEGALANLLRKQEGAEEVRLAQQDFTDSKKRLSAPVPAESRSYLPPTAAQLASRAAEDLDPAAIQNEAFTGPIFAKDGVFTISPGDITLVTGEDENSLLASNGLVVQYSDTRNGRSLQLTAQRGVVFTAPRAIKDIGRLKASDVRGFYLEGDVTASDGQYTLRGPRMYYDVTRNKAVVLDGVFWTYDRQLKLPLYVRADSIRQKSSNEFVAKRARMATSAFFEPDFTIGATTMTLSRRQVAKTPQGLLPTIQSWSNSGSASGSGSGSAGSGGASTGSSGLAIGPDAGGISGGTPSGYELPSDLATTSALMPSMVTENYIDARNVTLNAEGIPFFYWPWYEGTIEQPLLRSVRAENKSESGFALKTRWNAYRLIGLKGTPFTQADVMLDAYFGREAPGLGTILAWSGPDTAGDALMYGLFNDKGTDVLVQGTRLTYSGTDRGLVTINHAMQFDEHWSFFGEFAYQSDANFVESFYSEMAQTRREFISQGYVSRIEDNTAFQTTVKGSANNFVTNEYLLQSDGYYVSKLPELSYLRQADPLLSSWFGDALTWTQEYRVSRMAMKIDRVTPNYRGFTTAAQSQQVFGINPNQTLYESLTAQGYLPQDVYRADTRHEVDAKLELGPVNVVPFVVGRFTGYDHNFETFAGARDPRYRFWGSTGATASTQIQRVDNSFDSRMLDMHRVRHIIEPSAAFFAAATNRNTSTLPIYDEDVEAIDKGVSGRIGVNQIWQTQRGRPGRYYNADVFTLDMNLVDSTAETDIRSPVGRYMDYRPELSSFGKFGTLDSSWMVTDATTLSGGTVYDLNLHQQARSSVGVSVTQSPDVIGYADLRYLNALNLTTLGAGVAYRLANQYTIGLSTSYDMTAGDFQGLGANVTRDFQSMRLQFNISRSLISDQTQFGFTLVPQLGEARSRTPILGEQAPLKAPTGF